MQINSDLLISVENYIQEFFDTKISKEYVYHDFQHTFDVVEAALAMGKVYELSDRELELLQLAAWFHDTGYNKGKEGHEKRSAQIAREFLKDEDYSEEELDQIAACIMATKVPTSPKNLMEEILCDADLSHLGNRTYWDRCGRVRQELLVTQQIVMSEIEWVDFELNFVTKHQYHTPVARQMFDKRKQKHIKELWKQKLRLDPNAVDSIEALAKNAAEKAKQKKKKKKRKKDLNNKDLGRGVETMYRTTYRTHVNLSSIADNKANFMLTINSIIASIVMTSLLTQIQDNDKLVFPTLVLLAVCLTSLVFAILATRPKVTEGKFTREDIEQKRSNLLFFGNFYNMNINDFHWGMMEMIKDSDFLYSSMTRDLYYLGVVLAKKYKLLHYCYSIFMYGLILSVLTFATVLIFF